MVKSWPVLWALAFPLGAVGCGFKVSPFNSTSLISSINSTTGNSGGGSASIQQTGYLNLNTFQAAVIAIGQDNLTTGTQPGSPAANRLYYPGSPAIYNGTLYVPDAWNRIVGFNPIPTSSGAFASFVLGQNDDFNTQTSGNGAGELNYPLQVSISNGKLAVADYGNGRVVIYDPIPTGQANASYVFGQSGFGVKEDTCDGIHMYRPQGVILAGSKMVVADGDHNRVLIWNDWQASGSSSAPDIVLGQPNLTTCTSGGGTPAQGSSYMDRVVGVWTNGTKLFVTDVSNNRTYVWNTFPTADVNKSGTAPDFVLLSHGLSQSATDWASYIYSNGLQLFLIDNTNSRVLIWDTMPGSASDLPNKVIGQSVFTLGNENDDNQDNVQDAGPTGRVLYLPGGVTADANRLFVTDLLNHRVLIYNSQ